MMIQKTVEMPMVKRNKNQEVYHSQKLIRLSNIGETGWLKRLRRFIFLKITMEEDLASTVLIPSVKRNIVVF
jgi:hypothetical protein